MLFRPHGVETSERLAAQTRHQNRHLGVGVAPLATAFAVWSQANLLPRLGSLPAAKPLSIQDEAGNFAFLPGMDGPVIT